jgi:acetoin utilization deacetylase AcuC-like enzyme
MKIYYSKAHRLHDPEFEIFEGGVKLPQLDIPARLDRILDGLRGTGWTNLLPAEDFGTELLAAVHSRGYLEYLQTAFARWEIEGGELGPDYKSPVLIPACFPPRRSQKIPESVFGQAGYYAFGTGAPITAGTYPAAAAAANCALSAAQAVLAGDRAAFALCRPPGHHAGLDYCGGYCYLNNAAIAAKWLSARTKTAVLDIDYHAGNGTQDIFYSSDEVLTISIHSDPKNHYPSFMGYADECGEGAGLGYHRNFPLPTGTGDSAYLNVLDEALALVRDFSPSVLVVSAGMDIHESDPFSDFKITSGGIETIGKHIAASGIPALICLEGGYNMDTIGQNIHRFLSPFT